jgi:formate hydrogenlyase transcriptional activator
MNSEAAQRCPENWLLNNGPRCLEALVRTIVFHPSAPVLVMDDDRTLQDASVGAAKLLGLPRDQVVGKCLDSFVPPESAPQALTLSGQGNASRARQGRLKLISSHGNLLEVEFQARSQVLPVRHLLVLRAATNPPQAAEIVKAGKGEGPAWLQDFAASILDPEGRIVAWYPGAERIYGYAPEEVIGKHMSFPYPGGEDSFTGPQEALRRAASEGHFVCELWSAKKDGSRFWANLITVSLKDEGGPLRGFASVVRDFTDRHERDEKLRRSRDLSRPVPGQPTVAGVISGEYDRVSEANDAFLELIGYRREEFWGGKLHWPDLTPAEYSELDDVAHEECLRFGACAPYEKELVRKDGARVPVLVMTAVLRLTPFRWITFLQDLRCWDQPASPEQDTARGKANNFEEMVGASAALRRVLRQVEVVAPTDANVLILGETGTGKELAASAVHRLSPRKNGPFVTLNCAAIPTGLLESELFGYEKGAFTGAQGQKIGRLEMADKGTLFLDEVGDVPLELQPKLLRALQEKSFERLGGTRTTPIDIRLVAATNRNLAQMMRDKLFRPDLYYRLNVFPITLPPLRDRREDIPLLAQHFVRKYAGKMGRPIPRISPATMRALLSYSWPGNVRELENFIERAVILSQGSSLHAAPDELGCDSPDPAGGTLEEVEREHIVRVLRESGGVVSRAAARLGVPRTTLNAMMRKLGISRKNF